MHQVCTDSEMTCAGQADKIVHLLTKKVRVLTDEQLARTFFASAKKPIRQARETARRLEGKGLAIVQTSMVHPELLLEQPLLDWKPGDVEPNLDRLGWQTASRWTKPPLRTFVVSATVKARQLVGGYCGGRPERAREICHDIHVTSIFLHLRRTQPDWAMAWVPEDQTAADQRWRPQSRIPDAIIQNDPQVYVDFGGSYKAEKLKLIFAAWRTVRFQIW
jgi:hypothetical protein